MKKQLILGVVMLSDECYITINTLMMNDKAWWKPFIELKSTSATLDMNPVIINRFENDDDELHIKFDDDGEPFEHDFFIKDFGNNLSFRHPIRYQGEDESSIDFFSGDHYTCAQV